MKKILSFLLGIGLASGLAIAFAQSNVSSPNLFKLIGTSIVPINASSTIGTSSRPVAGGYFNNLTISGTCTGCSGAGGNSTSTFGFITATTSTATSTFNGSATILGNLGVGTSTFDLSNPSKISVDVGSTTSTEGITLSGWVNDFFEDNVMNRSSSTKAQACRTATANNGTLTSGFISICANSSTFNNPAAYNTGGAGDTSIMGFAGGDMIFVNATSGRSVFLVNGGSATSTNTALSISPLNTIRVWKGLADGVNATGTLGMVLQTTGTSTQWVGTSTLGFASTLTGTNGLVARWISGTNISTGVLMDNGTVVGANATSATTTFVVQGTGTLNPFSVASSTGTNLFTILANGNVGVASSTPGQRFSVSGNAYITGYLGVGTTSGARPYRVSLDDSSAGAGTSLKTYSTTDFGGLGDFYISNSNSERYLDFVSIGGQNGSAGGAGMRFITNSNTTNTGSVRLFIAASNGNIGVGSTTPGSSLSITGSGSIVPLTVASSSNSVMLQLGKSGLVSSYGESPTVATSTGIGATTGTATITGGQNSGTIRIVTGTAPVTSSVIATITLKESCTNGVVPVLYPGDATTATLSGTSMVFATGTSATAWVINSNTVALIGATTYQWNYIVACR